MTSCDYCENTDVGCRVIYDCDECGADCCSDCSEHDETSEEPRLLCNPAPESGHVGCYKPPVVEVNDDAL